MNDVMSKAIDLMLVAYPGIFIVTGLFIVATMLLKKLFPATAEGDEE